MTDLAFILINESVAVEVHVTLPICGEGLEKDAARQSRSRQVKRGDDDEQKHETGKSFGFKVKQFFSLGSKARKKTSFGNGLNNTFGYDMPQSEHLSLMVSGSRGPTYGKSRSFRPGEGAVGNMGYGYGSGHGSNLGAVGGAGYGSGHGSNLGAVGGAGYGSGLSTSFGADCSVEPPSWRFTKVVDFKGIASSRLQSPASAQTASVTLTTL